MKKIGVFIILFLIIFPIRIRALDTNASSAILMDSDSNRIIYSQNIHDIRSVASISKIMTAIIAIESGKLDNKIVVGKEIEKAYGSAIYIKEGEVLTLRDLVYGLMLRSGNDAALVIAKYVGKDFDGFVNMMNKKASLLKMKDSLFNNPSGLDEEKANYSSAYDMALLMSYAIRNSEFKKIVGTKKYQLSTNKNNYIWYNKNKLLNTYKYTTGGKTGYTKIAKRTLVTTASKNNLNLVVVTLNDGSDWSDHKKLYNYCFSNYKTYKILKKGMYNIFDEKYYSKYTLYIKNDYTYAFRKKEDNNVVIKINLLKKKKIVNNEKIGNIQVYLNKKMIHEERIYIKEKKSKKTINIKSWLGKIW